MWTKLLSLAGAGGLMLGCGDGAENAEENAEVAKAEGRSPVSEAKRWVKDGAVVLDVRTADEYQRGHASGAAHVPVQELRQRISDVERLTGGARDKPIVVYCASGRRSAQAKQLLEAAGYTRVLDAGSVDALLQ